MKLLIKKWYKTFHHNKENFWIVRIDKSIYLPRKDQLLQESYWFLRYYNEMISEEIKRANLPNAAAIVGYQMRTVSNKIENFSLT